jgi:hypothetical protein
MVEGGGKTMGRKDLRFDILTPDEPSTPVMASHHFPISFAAWDIVMVCDCDVLMLLSHSLKGAAALGAR